jgi:hypothetical protein
MTFCSANVLLRKHEPVGDIDTKIVDSLKAQGKRT